MKTRHFKIQPFFEIPNSRAIFYPDHLKSVQFKIWTHPDFRSPLYTQSLMYDSSIYDISQIGYTLILVEERFIIGHNKDWRIFIKCKQKTYGHFFTWYVVQLSQWENRFGKHNKVVHHELSSKAEKMCGFWMLLPFEKQISSETESSIWMMQWGSENRERS